MKNFQRIAVGLAALACLAATFVQSKNPDEVLSSINELRTKRIADARATNAQVDFAALNTEIEKMATEATVGVDPTKVEPAKAYLWAQIFSLAKKHKETCNLCELYLTSKPTPDQRFAAQTLMLSSCSTMGEGDMIASILPTVSAPDVATSQTLLRNVVNVYSGPIVEDMGTEAAIKAIDNALAQVKYESPDDYAKRMFDSFKSRSPKNRDGTDMTDEQITASLKASGESINSSLPYAAADKKHQLLADAGKKDEALKVLKDFVASVDPGNAYARRASSAIKQTEMIGTAAIPLSFDRQYGEFKNLEAWRGKVVIIDFTAHW